jgi:prevent-host-death family protein
MRVTISTKLSFTEHTCIMRSVNIHEAKTHLSRLVEKAAQGEAFIIAKAGKPLVKVQPLSDAEQHATKRLGFLAGAIAIPDDFDTMGHGLVEQLFTSDV